MLFVCLRLLRCFGASCGASGVPASWHLLSSAAVHASAQSACVCCFVPAGSTLALIEPSSKAVTELATPFSSYGGPTLAVHEVRLGGWAVMGAARMSLCWLSGWLTGWCCWAVVHRGIACGHVMVAGQSACQAPSVVQPSIVGSPPLAPCPARDLPLRLPLHLLIYLQADGKIKVAASAGSALAPGAVALLEVEGVEALAASKPEDWQLVQRSATSEVGGECLAVSAANSHFRLCDSLSVVVGDNWLTEWESCRVVLLDALVLPAGGSWIPV